MKKFVTQSKELTDVKWAKEINELGTVKTFEWPIKREIYVWESLGGIKALPVGSGQRQWRKFKEKDKVKDLKMLPVVIFNYLSVFCKSKKNVL